MKVTEAIKQLQKIYEKEGDIEFLGPPKKTDAGSLLGFAIERLEVCESINLEGDISRATTMIEDYDDFKSVRDIPIDPSV